MKLFVELIPIVVFFIVYQLGDIYLATASGMVVSIIQISIALLQKKPIALERWVSSVTVIFLSSITLITRNSDFIKWKPTIAMLTTAGMLALTSGKSVTLLEENFGDSLHLSKRSWIQLNNAWIIFFCLLGALNLLVAYTTETSTWVYFKLFGFLGLTVLFVIAQITYLSYFKKN